MPTHLPPPPAVIPDTVTAEQLAATIDVHVDAIPLLEAARLVFPDPDRPGSLFYQQSVNRYVQHLERAAGVHVRPGVDLAAEFRAVVGLTTRWTWQVTLGRCRAAR